MVERSRPSLRNLPKPPSGGELPAMWVLWEYWPRRKVARLGQHRGSVTKALLKVVPSSMSRDFSSGITETACVSRSSVRMNTMLGRSRVCATLSSTWPGDVATPRMSSAASMKALEILEVGIASGRLAPVPAWRTSVRGLSLASGSLRRFPHPHLRGVCLGLLLCEYRSVDRQMETILEATRTRVKGSLRALRRVAKRSRTLRRIKSRLTGRRQQIQLELAGLRARLAGEDGVRIAVKPENMVWIFGSGRSGSTWLRRMMGEMDGHQVWEEPYVGSLFGEFYARAPHENRRSADFIMGEPIRKGWRRSIRNFVLDGAGYSNPQTGADDYLVIKEPNGSVGAPLLMEALPESHMILLVRDPRDVVASVFDAARSGGWLNDQLGRDATGRDALADRKPNIFVKRRANVYLQSVGGAKQAYDAHRGPKVLVRYEDLRASTLD